MKFHISTILVDFKFDRKLDYVKMTQNKNVYWKYFFKLIASRNSKYYSRCYLTINPKIS